MTTSQTASIEKFNTVQEAVTTIRIRVWGQAKAKNCGYKVRADGACTMYTFMVGRITWKAYFDNYGRAITERA